MRDTETMEAMLDSLLEAVEGEADDDREAPARAVETLAVVLMDKGFEGGAEAWREVAAKFRQEQTSVKEFRAMTRRTLGKIAADDL